MSDERHCLWWDATLEELVAYLVAATLIGEADSEVVLTVQAIVNLYCK